MRVIGLAAFIVMLALLAAGEGQMRRHTAQLASSNAAADNRSPRNTARPPTDQEWASVLQWMKQHSPHRLAFLQTHMVRDQAQLRKAQQLIWNEYRMIQVVNYPPLREALVAQAETQDQVFGAQIALREARRSHNADQQDAARDALKLAVEKLVDGEQSVVEARIEKLQRDLARLKENRDRRAQRIYRQKLNQAGGLRTQDAAPPSPPDENAPQE